MTEFAAGKYPVTPDGRYFLVRGRLWRMSNPAVKPEVREKWVKDLMTARRAVRDAKDDPRALKEARAAVDKAKHLLGERGKPWWGDGAPDFNRHMVTTTPYADWAAALSADGQV